MKAQYAAAESMVQIGEATSGLGDGLAEAGRAIARARDKTEALTARAQALDELVAAGVADGVLGGETHIERELAELTTARQVDDELAALRREIEAPAPQ